ncbi:hypothetical protein [Sphingomonas sp. Root710]|uniref:hypothetical protein n=1 Tax=Sphingomonas sp. Root710 TaxID=1736594 RepID=UPI00138F2418|nr:hypothetical protein [Sphingomonas sp. Root710]
MELAQYAFDLVLETVRLFMLLIVCAGPRERSARPNGRRALLARGQAGRMSCARRLRANKSAYSAYNIRIDIDGGVLKRD